MQHRSSRKSRKSRKAQRKNLAAGRAQNRLNPKTSAVVAPSARPPQPQRPGARAARVAAMPAAAGIRSAQNEFDLSGYRRWMRQRALSPETLRAYLGTMRRVAGWLESTYETALRDATREQMQEWREYIDKLSTRTIRCYVAHVHSFYRWLEIEELRSVADPTRSLVMPRMPRGIPRPIREDDIEYVIDLAIDRIRPWLILAGYAGLRACEIATLRRDRIFDDAEDPYMIVIAKGGKERVVMLSPYVLGELLPILPRRGWLFLRRDGQQGHVPKHEITRLCNAHLKALGLVETLHKLRHRFGTQVQRAAGDLRVTQEALGHQDPKSSAVYSEVANADLIRAVNAVQPKGRRLRSVRRRAQ